MVPVTHFTRTDYMHLPEGFPAQLVDGSLVKRPTPPKGHQLVLGHLLSRIAEQLGSDHVLPGPLDVFLDDENVFQTDLVVFAEPRHWRPEDTDVGIPDVVIEVLSSDTADLDRHVKAHRYLEGGVGEVWLVDPEAPAIEIRTPGGSTSVGPGGTARSAVVPGLAVPVERLLPT